MTNNNVRYLIMVTEENNHNKFYMQTDNGDGTWTASYGRVGGTPQKRVYPMNVWDKKYNEKISKGYKNTTYLMEQAVKDNTYREIDNISVRELVEKLQKYARNTIKSNYTVSAKNVTKAQIDEAQRLIAELVNTSDVGYFNDTLKKVFSVIPRKMTKVGDFLAKEFNDFENIIKKEQDLLDIMKGQVIQNTKEDNNTSCNETILDKMGLEISECNDGQIAEIKKLLGESSNKLAKAWCVVNRATQDRFDNFVKTNNIRKTKRLFHGSRNENWWSILNTGLVLNPTNAVITGKMFGYGLYYAPRAKKSIGYTSLTGSYWTRGKSDVGYMAIMDVATGNSFDVYDHRGYMTSLTYDKLQKNCNGANSLHAHAGRSLRNDEIVVYKEEQQTIKYLIELKR